MKLMKLICNLLVIAGMFICLIQPMLGMILTVSGIWLFVLTVQRDISKEDK